MADAAEPLTDAALDLARRRAETRAELLDLLSRLPETRLYRKIERPGWTVRHVLSALAAAEAELVRLVEALEASPEDGPAFHLRRFRGEAMLRAHERRLSSLREHLDELGAECDAALARASHMLDVTLEIGGLGRATLRDRLAAHEAIAAQALEVLREHCPPPR